MAKFHYSIIASVCLLCVSGLSIAQSSLPTVNEIINGLSPQHGITHVDSQQSQRKRKTRGLTVYAERDIEVENDHRNAPSNADNQSTGALPDSAPNQQIQSQISEQSPIRGHDGGIASMASVYSESRITFEFGSDRLTEHARLVLNVFGGAISSPQLQGVKYIIEGHTDGIGSDRLNLELSLKRALAVHQYLVETLGVNQDLLSVRGKGKRELVNIEDPGSVENRRVVWIAYK